MVTILAMFLTWRSGPCWGSRSEGEGYWEEGSGGARREPEIRKPGSWRQLQAEHMRRALPPRRAGPAWALSELASAQEANLACWGPQRDH